MPKNERQPIKRAEATALKLKEMTGIGAELLQMAEAAVAISDGRLRLVHNQEDNSEKLEREAARFLKLDGHRLGRDIELYDFMGRGPVGWEGTLPMILEEVILPLRKELPKSYETASEKLKKMGEPVYKGDILNSWNELFK
jgi:hypothetical protein